MGSVTYFLFFAGFCAIVCFFAKWLRDSDYADGLLAKLWLALPCLLGASYVILYQLPSAFTFMPEPEDPWYTPYTTVALLLLNPFVYPATLASIGIGGMKAVGAPMHFGLVMVYSAYLSSLLIRFHARRFESVSS